MVAAHDTMHLGDRDFDTVAVEIAATLNFLGVPDAEHKGFMAIIEGYRPQVVRNG
jgi:hemoglobin